MKKLKSKIYIISFLVLMSSLFIGITIMSYTPNIGDFSIENINNNEIETTGFWDNKIIKDVGNSPEGVKTGDANNDGFLDIVSANRADNNITILCWDDENEDWILNATIGVGNSPYCIDIGDVNNDTYNDIVTANYGDNNVSIIRGKEDGSWKDIISKEVGTKPWDIAIGDVNNDGANDIVTANRVSDDISILCWDNNSEDWVAKSPISVGDSPYGVDIGDANNDGLNDIVTANRGSDDISILCWDNNSEDWVAETPISVGDSPYGVDIGDANNDGLNDIVNVNYGSDSISIIFGNNSNDWEDPQTRNVGSGQFADPYRLKIGDVNNDTLNDIVVGNFNDFDVSIFCWNDSTEDWNLEISRSVSGSPSDVDIGDANNDGINEIITTASNVGHITILAFKEDSTTPNGNGDGNIPGYSLLLIASISLISIIGLAYKSKKIKSI
jgi:hypothetical protein